MFVNANLVQQELLDLLHVSPVTSLGRPVRIPLLNHSLDARDMKRGFAARVALNLLC